MKVSLSWLKQYVDFDSSAPELADMLNSAGIEVSGIEERAILGDKVVVGNVVGLRPHPNADRLRLARVDSGTDEHEVVCGAPNLEVGQKIAFAFSGAVLTDSRNPDEKFTLTPAKIRGVRSEGMVCSQRELGLGDEHDGILVLNPDAKVGTRVEEILGDYVLRLEPTPNRSDCFSIVGVAREIAAQIGNPLKFPELDYPTGESVVDELARVEISSVMCNRFLGAVIQGVKIGRSPDWLRARLESLGENSINNVVDITNYVMLELGQPLHAFDYDRIKNHHIIVRQATDKERITTLDDEERTMRASDLLITDPKGAVAIAGVMGGLDSAISDGTVNLLIEAANFNGPNIRRTAHFQKMGTDASLRFGKGLHPELPYFGIRRAIRLILKVAGGTAAQGLVDVYPSPQAPRSATLPRKRIKYVLGFDIPCEEVNRTFSRLGFIHSYKDEQWNVEVPYWRTDIAIAEDLCEELARIRGYDSLPSHPLASPLPGIIDHPPREVKQRLIEGCVKVGLREVINYIATSEELNALSASGELGDCVRLRNPVSANHATLRNSLRPALIKVLAHNLWVERGPIKIFEVGTIYGNKDSEIVQQAALAGLISGPAQPNHWSSTSRAADFYDLKGSLENILNGIGIEFDIRANLDDKFFNPQASGTIVVKGKDVIIGRCGEVNTQILTETGIRKLKVKHQAVFMFELNVDKIVACLSEADMKKTYIPIVRQPTITRDINLVVDSGLRAADLLAEIPLKGWVKSVDVMDIYHGDDVPDGKRIVSLRIVYQSVEGALTVKQAESAENKLMGRLRQKLDVERRFSAN